MESGPLPQCPCACRRRSGRSRSRAAAMSDESCVTPAMHTGERGNGGFPFSMSGTSSLGGGIYIRDRPRQATKVAALMADDWRIFSSAAPSMLRHAGNRLSSGEGGSRGCHGAVQVLIFADSRVPRSYARSISQPLLIRLLPKCVLFALLISFAMTTAR